LVARELEGIELQAAGILTLLQIRGDPQVEAFADGKGPFTSTQHWDRFSEHLAEHVEDEDLWADLNDTFIVARNSHHSLIATPYSKWSEDDLRNLVILAERTPPVRKRLSAEMESKDVVRFAALRRLFKWRPWHRTEQGAAEGDQHAN
jgi:hypothetical protein